MKLYVIAVVPLVDNGKRYLLDSNLRSANRNIGMIKNSGNCIDAASPDYIVDVNCSLIKVVQSPGEIISMEEWRAIASTCGVRIKKREH